jgi:plastocyanin
MKRLVSLPTVAILLLLVALAAAACGGDSNGNGDSNGDGDGGSVRTSVATPADDDNGDGDDDDGDGHNLTLVSKNTLFDKTELRAEAGVITITHDNQDPGIVHNVHVYRGSDATGEDMGMTELEAGKVVQTLTLNLEPGEYFYVCDAHPATMYGKLIVE